MAAKIVSEAMPEIAHPVVGTEEGGTLNLTEQRPVVADVHVLGPDEDSQFATSRGSTTVPPAVIRRLRSNALPKKRATLVTGANTGIGQAIALGLARAGAEVIAAGRSSLDRTLELIAADGLKARPLELALDEPIAAAGKLLTLGPLDILVNNAGIIRRADAVSFTEADWDEVIDVNLKAVFFLPRPSPAPPSRARPGARLSTSPRCSPSRGASASPPTPPPSTASPG